MKRLILIVLLSFVCSGYTCDQYDSCMRQIKHMNADSIFCSSDQGIAHVNAMYFSF